MQETYRSPIIDSFLSKYVKKTCTMRTYRSAYKRYFTLLKTDPETYFKEDRDYGDDILKFAKSMEKIPAKSFNLYLAAVKKLLERKEVNIRSIVWEDAKNFRTGTRAVTVDRAPTNEELKNILTHADLQTRTMGLVLSSSGMRIGECCQIKLDDINWKSSPVSIDIQGEYTKSGNYRYVFISSEASDTLREWLKVREEYLKNAVKRLNITRLKQKKSTNDDRVFPITTSMARYLWNKYLEKAGSPYNKRDKRTRYYELHIHTLRKYFLSLMKLEIPEVIAEALAGHDAYLSEAYRRYTRKQMASYYLKGVKTLLVFERESEDFTHIREELTDLRDENKKLKEMMHELKFQVTEFRLEKLEKANGIKK